MEEFELYRQVLRQELELATGCTEPIAIAYAAALAYCYLSMRGEKPSFRILCRQFGSDFRRTVFYAARIASALEEDGSEQTDRP